MQSGFILVLILSKKIFYNYYYEDISIKYSEKDYILFVFMVWFNKRENDSAFINFLENGGGMTNERRQNVRFFN